MRNLSRRARLVGLTSSVLLAACSSTGDPEGTGATESAIGGGGDTVTLPTGNVPRKLVVTTAALHCAFPDCSKDWTDRFVDEVFTKHDPDIVMMTELIWDGSYDNLVARVGSVRKGVYNFYRGPAAKGLLPSGGTVIASKYPMSRKTSRPYEASALPDSLARKGVAAARQELGKLADGQRVFLDVLVTHNQAMNGAIVLRQMQEQAAFIRESAVWGGSSGSTLKIFTGDINVSGAGPSWLGGTKEVRAGQSAFGWLRDNTLLRFGFRDGTDTCAPSGVERAGVCASRAFVEREPWEVIKQMYTPYSKLEPEGFVKPVVDPPYERGITMVPEKAETFDTVSDHDAKQVTYGLYILEKRRERGVESTPRRGLDGGIDAAPPHEE